MSDVLGRTWTPFVLMKKCKRGGGKGHNPYQARKSRGKESIIGKSRWRRRYRLEKGNVKTGGWQRENLTGVEVTETWWQKIKVGANPEVCQQFR